MNTLQVQACVDVSLACQTTARLLLASVVTSAIRLPRTRQHFPVANPRGPPRLLHQQRCAPLRQSPRNLRPIHPFPSTIPSLHPLPTTTRTYTTTPPQNPQPTVHPVFEPKTGTFQYLVADPSSSAAVIIDPVLDYDKCTHSITTASADSLLALAREKGYTITRILETHAHADHLTAAFYLQRRLAEQQGGEKPAVCIGKRIGKVQSLFGQRYGIDAEEYEGVFDQLLEDDEEFEIGGLRAKAIHLPGHTPDHMGYRVGDNIFCGDSLFHIDLGTARCDFPGGSAHALYQSAQKVLALPDHVRIWTGHDYPPEGVREPVPSVSVAEHREKNKHLKTGVTEDEFVAMRSERDSHLAAPRLLHESLQVNIRGGRLPKENEVGMRLLKVPVKVKGAKW